MLERCNLSGGSLATSAADWHEGTGGSLASCLRPDGDTHKVPASRVERAGGGDGCEDIRWDRCARPSAARVTGGPRSFTGCITFFRSRHYPKWKEPLTFKFKDRFFEIPPAQRGWNCGSNFRELRRIANCLHRL